MLATCLLWGVLVGVQFPMLAVLLLLLLLFPPATGSVRYGAGRGGFALCDPAVTRARGQLFAVPPRPV